MAKPAPDLRIPSSNATVQVSIIDTTSYIRGIPGSDFLENSMPGFDGLNCPAYSFLIEHSSGSKLLFDLGIRKNWDDLPPKVVDRLKGSGWDITVQKDVDEILSEQGVEPKEINGIVWSHHHFDHTGDPSRFPKTTELIVGPGFKKSFMPGYPENPEAAILVSDYSFVAPSSSNLLFSGRTLREIDFKEKPLKIGNFEAYDFFGDGSYYLLDTPGHTKAHLSGLARTTIGSGKDSFILMGGDFSHHGGEFRPSQYNPLPSSISPHPFKDQRAHNQTCPGALFEKIHPTTTSSVSSADWTTEPFFRPSAGFTDSVPQAIETIEKVQEADGHEEVLVVMAHDATLLDVVEFFPKKANDWLERGWGADTRWAFLGDFQNAIATVEKKH
ncbi:hypothetical protein MMC13_005625 [Lambiella insularis]|nr:hypothetical protein [Lambiella insularis]